MLRSLGISALIGVYLVGVLLVDFAVWSGHNLPVLYAIPVLLVSLRWQPRYVLAIAAVTMALAIASIVLERPSLLIWPFTLSALLVVCFISVLISLRRHEELDRIRHEQEMIRAAENLRQPLTVVLGNAQLLERDQNLSETTIHRVRRIKQAAQRMAEGITALLNASSN